MSASPCTTTPPASPFRGRSSTRAKWALVGELLLDCGEVDPGAFPADQAIAEVEDVQEPRPHRAAAAVEPKGPAVRGCVQDRLVDDVVIAVPPKQRATLILRDVLGFSASEVARALGTSVPSVTNALQRARLGVQERLPQRSQQATIRSLGARRARELARRFVDAFERGDVDLILAMLADDATFAMPPYPSWCRGRAAIAASWLMPGGPPPRLRYVETEANGQPAAGVYLLDGREGRYQPICLDVLTLRGPRIADVTAFRMPELFRRFGLPSQLLA